MEWFEHVQGHVERILLPISTCCGESGWTPVGISSSRFLNDKSVRMKGKWAIICNDNMDVRCVTLLCNYCLHGIGISSINNQLFYPSSFAFGSCIDIPNGGRTTFTLSGVPLYHLTPISSQAHEMLMYEFSTAILWGHTHDMRPAPSMAHSNPECIQFIDCSSLSRG